MDPDYEQPLGLPGRYNMPHTQRKSNRMSCCSSGHLARVSLIVQCCLVVVVCAVLGVVVYYSYTINRNNNPPSELHEATDVPTVNQACENGWIKGLVTSTSCYKFLTDEVSWQEAQSRCKKMGGYLANLETVDEIIWLRGYRSMNLSPWWKFWIGGAKSDYSGWVWIDGEGSQLPMMEEDWGPNQPDNMYDNQSCLALFGFHKNHMHRWMCFDDEDCSKDHRFICEVN